MYVELTGQSAATVLSPEGMLAELELLTFCVPKTLNRDGSTSGERTSTTLVVR